jgi:hypothetical protein
MGHRIRGSVRNLVVGMSKQTPSDIFTPRVRAIAHKVVALLIEQKINSFAEDIEGEELLVADALCELYDNHNAASLFFQKKPRQANRLVWSSELNRMCLTNEDGTVRDVGFGA